MHVLGMQSTRVVFASPQCCCHSPSKGSVLAGAWQGQTCSACVWAAEHSVPGSWGQKEKSCPGTCHLPVCALMTPSYKSVCHLIEVCTTNYQYFLNCKNAFACCDKMGRQFCPVLFEAYNFCAHWKHKHFWMTVPILLTVWLFEAKIMLGLTLWNPACWSCVGNKTVSEVWPVIIIIIKCS